MVSGCSRVILYLTCSGFLLLNTGCTKDKYQSRELAKIRDIVKSEDFELEHSHHNASFCSGFLKDLKKGRNIHFIKPVAEANRYDAPVFDKYHLSYHSRCGQDIDTYALNKTINKTYSREIHPDILVGQGHLKGYLLDISEGGNDWEYILSSGNVGVFNQDYKKIKDSDEVFYKLLDPKSCTIKKPHILTELGAGIYTRDDTLRIKNTGRDFYHGLVSYKNHQFLLTNIGEVNRLYRHMPENVDKTGYQVNTLNLMSIGETWKDTCIFKSG